MRQTTLKLKNSKPENFRIKYFYQKFIEETKGKFYPNQLDLDFKKKSNQKQIQISKFLFTKIISVFLKIYFNDLIFKTKDSYFLLGGRMTIAKLKAKIRIPNSPATPFNIKDNLVFIWYRRPSKRDYYMVKIKKHQGPNGQIRILEEKARSQNMLDLFPNFKKVKLNFLKTKQLYKCIQK